MSESRAIARAAGLIGALTAFSRVAGLLRDVVIGYAFGTGLAADAFFVAFRIPNLLRRFVAEGAMSVAFVPVFTEYLTTRPRGEAVRAARVLATAMVVLLVVLTVLGVALAPLGVALFAPGFAAEPEKMALTVRLTRLLFPYVMLVSLVAVLGGLLNALRHFIAPALSPVLLNASMIGFALLLSPHLATPIYGLAYGVLCGGVLQVAIQVAPLRRRGIDLRPLWQPRHPAVRRVIGLMAPTVFSAAVYQINILLSTVLASLLPAGSVSFLWYADRVFEFPLGVFAVALGTAALPTFAAQAARGAYEELSRSLSAAIRTTNLIAVPAAVGLVVLATPITAVLFGRGAFGAAEVELTAAALRAFAVGLWSLSVLRVLVPAFYAVGDTRTPVWTASAAFGANAVFSLMFMGPVAATGSGVVVQIARLAAMIGVWDLRHAGLALATSAAATVNLALLAAVLSRRLRGVDYRGLALSLARSAAAAAVMAPALALMAGLLDWKAPGGLASKMVLLAATIGAGLGVFTAVAWLLGAPELDALMRTVRERIGPQRHEPGSR